MKAGHDELLCPHMVDVLALWGPLTSPVTLPVLSTPSSSSLVISHSGTMGGQVFNLLILLLLLPENSAQTPCHMGLVHVKVRGRVH